MEKDETNRLPDYIINHGAKLTSISDGTRKKYVLIGPRENVNSSIRCGDSFRGFIYLNDIASSFCIGDLIARYDNFYILTYSKKLKKEA